MSTYTHIEKGGEYYRSEYTGRLKLHGDDGWTDVVIYCSVDDLGSQVRFVTDEKRWAERFRENPQPTAEEWAEVRKGLVIDLHPWSDDDDSEGEE